MKTLLEIKNHYAQEYGYEDWDELKDVMQSYGEEMESCMTEICIRAQKAALEKASENAECNLYIKSIYRTKRGNHWRKLKEGMEYDPTTNNVMAKIDHTSITNPENLIR